MRIVLSRIVSAILAAVFGGWSASGDQTKSDPERLEWPRSDHGYVTVNYPENFDAGARAYHLLFWFHGNGGQPESGIGVLHPDFISIGMSYLKREHVPPGEYAAAHWKECLAIRAELEERGIKLRRNLAGGMSKGGWAAFYIGADALKCEGLGGVAIFGAGRDPRYRAPPKLGGREFSVLIGTGEIDPNYPQAQLAYRFFRDSGAPVYYEEWLGLGHSWVKSPRIKFWLAVEALKDRPEKLEQLCTLALEEEWKRTDGIESPLQRYIAFRHLIRDPRFPHAAAPVAARIRDAGRKLGDEPAIKEWLEEFSRLQSFVAKEADFVSTPSFDVPKLAVLVDHYRNLARTAASVEIASRAAFAEMRAGKLHAIYSSQLKAFETPEYKSLIEEYTVLQKKYRAADGNPGDEAMERLKEIGARLGELRHEASKTAFQKAEHGSGRSEPSENLRKAKEFDRSRTSGERAYGGIGF